MTLRSSSGNSRTFTRDIAAPPSSSSRLLTTIASTGRRMKVVGEGHELASVDLVIVDDAGASRYSLFWPTVTTHSLLSSPW